MSIIGVLGFEPEPWMAEGVCQSVDPELWFPPKGASGMVKTAKEICSGCGVVDRCLQFALENNEREGIWGATTSTDRRVLRREQRDAA